MLAQGWQNFVRILEKKELASLVSRSGLATFRLWSNFSIKGAVNREHDTGHLYVTRPNFVLFLWSGFSRNHLLKEPTLVSTIYPVSRKAPSQKYLHCKHAAFNLNRFQLFCSTAFPESAKRSGLKLSFPILCNGKLEHSWLGFCSYFLALNAICPPTLLGTRPFVTTRPHAPA